MKKEDFLQRGINFFTEKEITKTGAKLEDVSVELMVSVNKFRRLLNRVVILVYNGLTTGNHKSKEHKNGLAVDVCFRECDGPINADSIVYTALSAGFTGIGVYNNSFAYSAHLDLRTNYTFWAGYKKHREIEWKYCPLLIDIEKLV